MRNRCQNEVRPVERTIIRSRPEPPSARSRVAVTSCAVMVAQSFQATMKREKSSSTLER